MSGFDGHLHGRVTNPQPGQTGAYQSISAAADVLRFGPHAPVMIVRWGFIATVTVNDATNALKLTGDVRPTAGSNAARTTGSTTTLQGATGYNATNQPSFLTDTAGGSITLTAGATQLAAGQGVFHDMNPQAGSGTPNLYPQPDTAFVSPGGVDTQLIIYPGQEFVIAVQPNAPAAGQGILFVEYREMPFVGLGYSGLPVQVPSSIVPTPSRPGGMTRVQS